MTRRRNDLLRVRPGNKYKRCCGADPTRREALADISNAAALLPALRPVGAAALRYCARLADELGENDGSVPDDIAAAGVALVDDSGSRTDQRATFCEAAPDVWERLAEVANHAERELVGSAVRGARCDRRPVPRTQLVVIEMEESLPDEAGVRLGAVLPSGALWSSPTQKTCYPSYRAVFSGVASGSRRRGRCSTTSRTGTSSAFDFSATPFTGTYRCRRSRAPLGSCSPTARLSSSTSRKRGGQRQRCALACELGCRVRVPGRVAELKETRRHRSPVNACHAARFVAPTNKKALSPGLSSGEGWAEPGIARTG